MSELLADNPALYNANDTMPVVKQQLHDDVQQPSHTKSPTDVVRVLHVINGEHYSGAERVQDLLAACLPAEGFNVGFACVKPGRFAEMRKSQISPLYDVPMRTKFDLRVAWRLARIIRNEDYRLIHAHTPRTAMVARVASTLTGVPYVYHVHSPTSRDSTRRLHNWLNTRIENWSVKRAAKLITVSASLGQHMRQLGFSAETVNVVPNGVPVSTATRCATPPSGTWTLGTVALFRPRKGTEVLLDALSLLKQNGHDVRLRAVGPFETTQYEEEIKNRAADLNVTSLIDWTGITSDVNAHLSKMDLFVLPSLFGEGLPMVVLEAMAAGLPVVATNVEGVPEAIRDRVDGMIAHARDPEDLARVISRVIDGIVDWTTLRENAMRRHREKFSDQCMAAGVAEVYRELLNTAVVD